MILSLIASIYVGSAFRKGKEKDHEEIAACLSRNPIKHIVSELKKKKFKKLEWEINKVTKIDGLQGLFGLNLYVKGWQDENGDV